MAPVAALRPLTPVRTVAGRVACLIGGDLYLETAQGLVLLDTRLLTGWALDRAAAGTLLTAELEPLHTPSEAQEQDALF